MNRHDILATIVSDVVKFDFTFVAFFTGFTITQGRLSPSSHNIQKFLSSHTHTLSSSAAQFFASVHTSSRCLG